jgi:AcrR family transcriptional regulator
MNSRRPELSREFIAGHKRRRMIDATAELVAERGYEATKIAEIVRRAAVARKTLYDCFEGKEELFLESVDTYLAELREAVVSACEKGDGPTGGVEAGLRAVILFVAERPVAARVCMVEATSATPASAARYDAALCDFVAMLGKSAPRAAALPETIEESLVGGVAWILQQQIRRGEAERAEELLPELTQFLLTPYRSAASGGRSRRRGE